MTGSTFLVGLLFKLGDTIFATIADSGSSSGGCDMRVLLSSEICRMVDCCVEEAATLARLSEVSSSVLAATFCVYCFLVLGIIMSLMGKLKMASVLNHGKL